MYKSVHSILIWIVVVPYSIIDDIIINDNMYIPNFGTLSNMAIMNVLLGLSLKSDEFLQNHQRLNNSLIIFTDGYSTDKDLTPKCREVLDKFRKNYGHFTKLIYGFW